MLRFGLRETRVRFREESALRSAEMRIPRGLAEQLCLGRFQKLTLWRSQDKEVTLGPLIGLLISRESLRALRGGRRSPVCCQYARYAREIGAVLVFFTSNGIDRDRGTVRGYVHRCRPWGNCRWVGRTFPIPRVVYDRCLRRREAVRVRRLAEAMGFAVINHLGKMRKLQAFELLAPYSELAPYLPFTARLTADSLAMAMERYKDIYLKPNGLSKGQGVCRLTREEHGWRLQSHSPPRTRTVFLPPGTVAEALSELIASPAFYLLQEGLPLATYLGNRFDFRSLVQKDGQGEWVIGGLVARIAPRDSPVTSPRSGGMVAHPERVLRNAFPDRWEKVLEDLERVSLRLAARIDQRLGPCAELGLDLGVLQDGTVKLIEVNAKPLKVSLQRLNHPLVKERIHRYPIHYAAYLDLTGVAPCNG